MRRGPTIFISHFLLHILHQVEVKQAHWISTAFGSDSCRISVGPMWEEPEFPRRLLLKFLLFVRLL